MNGPIELYHHYRTEVQHEMSLMLARLNALLTSQSFLVIAYASSMAIANGHWSQPLAMLLPPFLALLGFVLAVEGRIGIVAARRALGRWQHRLDDLVGSNASLIDWADLMDEGVRDTRRAGELFAVRSPMIFMGAWVFLFALPLVLRMAG
ncbi:MAG: hypothetical protein EOP64_02680 [Sphingomonas sp.]|nr:MAG: hypothetical protein EOP64_02680 [Sphingomonas sp.]